MIYLDASGLLALLLGEPGAQDVEGLLRGGEVAMTAVNYAEVIDQAVRVQGKLNESVDHALDPLVTKGMLRITDVTPAVGLRAGRLRSQHYDRKRCPLSLADCVLLGAASVEAAEVATSDQFVVDVGIAAGLTVRALPNSVGVRPRVK